MTLLLCCPCPPPAPSIIIAMDTVRNTLPPLESSDSMYEFFWRDRKHRAAVTAIAVFLAFILALTIIYGAIVFGHWWTTSSSSSSASAASSVQPVAETTRAFAFIEELALSDCPPEYDCLITTTTQSYSINMFSALPYDTAIGTGVGKCVAVGNANGTVEGAYQHCMTTYAFNGAAGIDAGTLVVEGVILSPQGEDGRRISTWAVTGGTLRYAMPNGGVLTTMDTVSGAERRSAALTYVTVN